MKMDDIEMMELIGGRGGWFDNNCANCGYGLTTTGCDNCGHTFTHNGVRSGWSTPVPEKVVNLLMNEYGFRFALTPHIAWLREQQLFDETKRTKKI